MGMFEMSDSYVEEYRQTLRTQAEERVSEPVVAAAIFRRGGAAERMAISKAGLGALVYAASALRSKERAGGLPDKALLVATPTKLHAFKARIKGRGIKIGEEVAAWDRAALRVSSQPKAGLTMLTIEVPADGRTVTLAPVGVRDDPVSLEMIAALQQGAAAPPASR